MAEIARPVSLAVRHARWRWAGAPLLLSGAGLLMLAVAQLAQGGSFFTLGLCLFGTGLALASFGANHDTAIAMCVKATQTGARTALPAPLLSELEEELQRDRAGTLGLKAVPRIALAMPFIAIAVQGFAGSRLFG